MAKYSNALNLDKKAIIDISIDNKDVYKNEQAYEYALDMTEREVRQAAEGLFHNLNSLQSRSGNQLNKKWLAI